MTILSEKLSSSKYAIFDFDGTIYPGLLIFDLAKDYFSNLEDGVKKNRKIKQLLNLLDVFKKGDFYSASKDFAKLLKDEPVDKFYSNLDLFLGRIYPQSKEFIDLLKNANVDCYLVSLTSKVIAKKVANLLGFKSWLSIEYGVYLNNNINFFDGTIHPEINNPAEFKVSCFSKFGIKDFENSIAIGDSSDDILIFEKCNYTLLVGSSADLSKLNISFRVNADWSNFTELQLYIKQFF